MCGRASNGVETVICTSLQEKTTTRVAPFEEALRRIHELDALLERLDPPTCDSLDRLDPLVAQTDEVDDVAARSHQVLVRFLVVRHTVRAEEGPLAFVHLNAIHSSFSLSRQLFVLESWLHRINVRASMRSVFMAGLRLGFGPSPLPSTWTIRIGRGGSTPERSANCNS